MSSKHNHMVNVETSVVASDNCNTPTIALAPLSSNEADNAMGAGDGNTTGDTHTTLTVPSGGELFLSSSLLPLWGGVEAVGGGTVILLGDVNMISNVEDTAGNDNHIFFLNLAGAGTPGAHAEFDLPASKRSQRSLRLIPRQGQEGLGSLFGTRPSRERPRTTYQP